VFEGIGEPQPVLLYGDPRLAVECRPAVSQDQDCQNTIAELVLTHARCQGFGLAAPQIGRDLRIFVIRDESIPGKVRICLNPEILKRGGQQIVPEGCLSIPGIRVSIKRPKNVIFRYTNVDGEVIVMEAEDLGAAVLCHEVDHLDGKLILDHVGRDRRRRLVRQHKKHRAEMFRRAVAASRQQ